MWRLGLGEVPKQKKKKSPVLARTPEVGRVYYAMEDLSSKWQEYWMTARRCGFFKGVEGVPISAKFAEISLERVELHMESYVKRASSEGPTRKFKVAFRTGRPLGGVCFEVETPSTGAQSPEEGDPLVKSDGKK